MNPFINRNRDKIRHYLSQLCEDPQGHGMYSSSSSRLFPLSSFPRREPRAKLASLILFSVVPPFSNLLEPNLLKSELGPRADEFVSPKFISFLHYVIFKYGQVLVRALTVYPPVIRDDRGRGFPYYRLPEGLPMYLLVVCAVSCRSAVGC